MSEIKKLYLDLQEIMHKEEMRLWRIANNAKKHGCSFDLFADIQREAWAINKMDVDTLLSCVENDIYFKYAFGGSNGKWVY